MLNLVAGGAGFLGSNLVDALIAQGEQVIVADNLCTGSLRNLDRALRGGLVTFVYLDVSRPASEFRDLLKKAARSRRIGRIFHFAVPAPSKARANPKFETRCSEALGTMSLIDFGIEQNARLIFASTRAMNYGPFQSPTPQPRGSGTHSTLRQSVCEECNLFAEAAISRAVANRGLDARIVRFSNCYGPRMSREDGGLISAFFEAIQKQSPLPIHGDGLQTHPMVFVDDAVRQLIAVASTEQSEFAPVDVAADHRFTISDIAAAFSRVSGAPIIVDRLASRPCNPQHCSPAPATRDSKGNTRRTRLDDGLAKTIAWLQNSAGVYV